MNVYRLMATAYRQENGKVVFPILPEGETVANRIGDNEMVEQLYAAANSTLIINIITDLDVEHLNAAVEDLYQQVKDVSKHDVDYRPEWLEAFRPMVNPERQVPRIEQYRVILGYWLQKSLIHMTFEQRERWGIIAHLLIHYLHFDQEWAATVEKDCVVNQKEGYHTLMAEDIQLFGGILRSLTQVLKQRPHRPFKL